MCKEIDRGLANYWTYIQLPVFGGKSSQCSCPQYTYDIFGTLDVLDMRDITYIDILDIHKLDIYTAG